jgi:hypothetical protein
MNPAARLNVRAIANDDFSTQASLEKTFSVKLRTIGYQNRPASEIFGDHQSIAEIHMFS